MSPPARVLLVDDEMALQRAIAPLLRSRGLTVSIAGTAREAVDLFERERPHLVVLDLGLPDLDGAEVCRYIRERADTPILILSARSGEKDKVAALDGGADDFVTKPFSPDELLARVRAALRRGGTREDTQRGQLARGPLRIDFDTRRVHVGDADVHLTPKEFDLLALLVANNGRVLTHRTISRTIWGPQFTDQSEHLRVLIGQLRKKIETDPTKPRLLLTEPWVGYRFSEEAD